MRSPSNCSQSRSPISSLPPCRRSTSQPRRREMALAAAAVSFDASYNGMNATEEEFLKLYQLQKTSDTKYGGPPPPGSMEWSEYQQQIRTALGEQRSRRMQGPVQNSLMRARLGRQAHRLQCIAQRRAVLVVRLVMDAEFHASTGTRKSRLMPTPKVATRSRNCVRNACRPVARISSPEANVMRRGR